MKHEMHVLGIDIAKRVFHAVGMDDRGNIVYRKRLSRHDLMPCIATLPPGLIGIEACGGAHYWARRFRGHWFRLMSYAHEHNISGRYGWRESRSSREEYPCHLGGDV